MSYKILLQTQASLINKEKTKGPIILSLLTSVDPHL